MTQPIHPEGMQEELAGRLCSSVTISPATTESGANDELQNVQAMFPEDFAELAALFQADSTKRIAALYAAAVEENAVLMNQIAHVLSGSCASIGATLLAALCQDLEAVCKAGLPSDFASRLGRINTEYLRIETKLQSMMRSNAI